MLQRGDDQRGVVVGAHRVAEQRRREQVHDGGQIQLALTGVDLGHVAAPGTSGAAAVNSPRDQVRRGRPLALAGQPAAGGAWPAAGQAELGHQLRDVFSRDLPALLAQLDPRDPRRAVGAARVVEELPDLVGRQLGPPHPAGVLVAGRATCRTTTPTPQRPAGHRVRHAVLGPLGAMNAATLTPVASLTHRTTDRLRTSRSIASSAFSRRSRASSARSSSDSCPAAASPRASRSCFTQFASVPVVDPQIPRDLRDRLTGLPHDAHRTRPELRIEPASRLSHEPLSLKVWPPRYEGKGRCSAAPGGSDSPK